jgi:1-acyl-sn-glycerol-3-phosphate acyltransferase
MRALLVGLTFLLVTPTIGGLVFVAAMLRLPDRRGSIYDWGPRLWAKAILWAGGVRLHLHNAERISRDGARIYVANHISLFDVFALAGVLPRSKWIAKAELLRIPIFGPAAKAAGMIFIERNNGSASRNARRGRAPSTGTSTIVCPEGTRGDRTPALQKGPSSAIAAGVPSSRPSSMGRSPYTQGARRAGGDVLHFWMRFHRQPRLRPARRAP